MATPCRFGVVLGKLSWVAMRRDAPNGVELMGVEWTGVEWSGVDLSRLELM